MQRRQQGKSKRTHARTHAHTHTHTHGGLSLVPRNPRECGRKLIRSRRNISLLRDYSAVVPEKSIIFSQSTGDLRRIPLGKVASYGCSTGKDSTGHCPPLLMPGQGSMTIFNVWFLILQATSLARIWPKVNLFWSDFGEKCLFRVF